MSAGLLLVVGLAACGGDDDDATAAVESDAIESRASNETAAAWYQQSRGEIEHIKEAIEVAVADIGADATRCAGYSPLLGEVSESPLNDPQRAHQTWLDVVGAFSTLLVSCSDAGDGNGQATVAVENALDQFDEWTASVDQAT